MAEVTDGTIEPYTSMQMVDVVRFATAVLACIVVKKLNRRTVLFIGIGLEWSCFGTGNGRRDMRGWKKLALFLGETSCKDLILVYLWYDPENGSGKMVIKLLLCDMVYNKNGINATEFLFQLNLMNTLILRLITVNKRMIIQINLYCIVKFLITAFQVFIWSL